MKLRYFLFILSFCLTLAARAQEVSFEYLTDLSVAAANAERIAVSSDFRWLLTTDPEQQEIHLHRADWAKPSLTVVDAFPPTDSLMAIPTPGRPMAIAVHPSQPLAIALSRPLDPRARGEVLFLDLREKSPGRLLRSQLVGFRPESVAISPDGRWALVANGGRGKRSAPGSVGFLDLQNLSGWEDNRLQEVPYREFSGLPALLGKSATSLNPTAVAISADGRLAAVLCRKNNAIVWIDLRGAEPVLAGVTELPRGSRPTSLSLLDEADGSVLAGVAERGDQRVSFFRVTYSDAAVKADLLSREDIRPLVDEGRPREERDPREIVLGRVAGRPFAWIASKHAQRVVMLDLADPAHPQLARRAASTAPARSLLLVEVKNAVLVVTANERDAISVLRARATP
ncbi:MAG: hypothetical protein M9963_05795 [Kiritimatiellae bacterium]|nr:hypothetical protein [Kiritimatiellia bacterium]